ncbi:MAG: PH domain-containing protein [Oscillospiraceae bacterium]
MDFILYFLLRRFTVRLTISKEYIRLIKGLIIRRDFFVPFEAVTLIEQRQTVIMRLFGAKKITIHTLSGRGFTMWLKNSEKIIDVQGAAITPKKRSMLLGALVDTRALSGVVVFLLTMRRLYTVLGSGYYDKAIAALYKAAGELRLALERVNITIPQIAAVAAIIVALAWLGKFAWKLFAMSRFRVIAMRDYIVIRRGFFTLYQCAVVRRNINAVITTDNLTTLIFGAAPLYVRHTMIFPPAPPKIRRRVTDILCGIPCEYNQRRIKPPFRAIFGHCAQPLSWFAAFGGIYGLLWLGQYLEYIPPVTLLRSVMLVGAAVSLWYAAVYAVYMFRSSIICTEYSAEITARRGARLYTAAVNSKMRTQNVLSRNIFQLVSGLCDAEIRVLGGARFRLRNIPHKSGAAELMKR